MKVTLSCACRAGPIPLSAFGEDDDTAVEEQNPLEIAWNTLSPVAYSTSAAPPHKRPELQGAALSFLEASNQAQLGSDASAISLSYSHLVSIIRHSIS